MSRVRLGVVFGSRSVEHEVSVITATQLMQHINDEQYDCVPLYIDKSGRWWTGQPLRHAKTFATLDLAAPQLPGIEPITFSPDPTVDHGVDVVISCTHGGHGEDGTLAGLFELANIPYAAPGVVAAALSIDKIATKRVLRDAGFPITEYEWFFVSEWQQDQKAVLKKLERLPWPRFVKPATLGSSVGVTKVTTPAEQTTAIELVAHFDERVIVEASAEDTIEINISVAGSALSAEVSVTEQPLKLDAFLSYADKYERGGKGGKKGGAKGMASLSRRIPAPIAPDFGVKLQETAKEIWREFNGSGVARIDFLVDPSTEAFFITELNCPPGSMAYYLWEASGVSYPQLIDHLVKTALQRQQRKNALLHSIQSNILKKDE